MTETTVGKIKVGTKLMLGQYGVSAHEVFPIMWLKATPNGDFISEKVLDYICFDARERQSDDYSARMYGNPDYGVSNIMQFLNSYDENWWKPAHGKDMPPDGNNVFQVGDAYNNHCGFLYHFEDYEIDSIVKKLLHTSNGAVKSLMRLPSYEDFFGTNRFQLFSAARHPPASQLIGTSAFGEKLSWKEISVTVGAVKAAPRLRAQIVRLL